MITSRPRVQAARQQGSVLLVAMVMLLMAAILTAAAFRGSLSSAQAIGNMQWRAEAITAADLARYPAAHRALYRGRLWVNLVARVACTRPAFASTLLGVTRLCPSLLGMLTSKVTAASLRG